jgi:hypothetical protein
VRRLEGTRGVEQGRTQAARRIDRNLRRSGLRRGDQARGGDGEAAVIFSSAAIGYGFALGKNSCSPLIL